MPVFPAPPKALKALRIASCGSGRTLAILPHVFDNQACGGYIMRTKTGLFAAAIVLSIILTACSGNKADQGKTPSGMNIQRGRNYKEVIEDFEYRGFTNIRTEPIEDLVFGWVVKNGEVEEISVGGDTNYDAGVWIPLDTEIVIRYHTFKTGETGAAENTEAAQEEQAENANAGDASTKSAETASP